MNECEECGKTPATIHLMQVVNNSEVGQVHLCEDCARDKGVSIVIDPEKMGSSGMMPQNIPPQIAQMMQAAVDASRKEEKPDPACGTCGLLLSEFVKTGRLGCPECYTVFGGEIDRVLLRFGDSILYKGKPYHSENGPSTLPDGDETFLAAELARAVTLKTSNLRPSFAIAFMRCV